MKSVLAAGLSLAVFTVGTLVWVAVPHLGPARSAHRVNRPLAPSAALDEAARAVPGAAEETYRRYVRANEDSRDPKVQDAVASARMHLGYAAAHRQDWSRARDLFLIAERRYRGENQRSPGFGTIPEQAAYQAAVCLVGAGKKVEAQAALKAYIVQRPLAPLALAAYRRLVRLGGAKPEVDALIQRATELQQAQGKQEMRNCGPKALAKLLELTGKGKVDLSLLASLCKVDED